MRLTERDFRLLSWIGEQLLINKCELAKLLLLDAEKHKIEGLGKHVTTGMISRWKRYKLIDSFHQLRRGSHIYLTSKGTQTIGLQFKAATPGRNAVAHLTHHDAVNRLRIHLEREAWQAGRELLWQSERRLMQLEREKNGEYVFGKKAHRPDALILEQGSGDIALEVERTYKRPKRLQSILSEYLYHPQYALVRYYCSSEKIQENVMRALKTVLSDTPLIHQGELQQKICILALPFNEQS